jgi:hypothetical protein
MRQIIAAVAPAIVMALALAVPGAAFGHGRHDHHHRDGARHHKRHHAKSARVIKFTPVAGSTEGSSEGTSGEPGGTATESIGTVASYEKGVLAIKLSDGSLMSGKVTGDTHVACVSATSSEGTGESEGDGFKHEDHSSWGDWLRQSSRCAEPGSEEAGAEPSEQGSDSSGWHEGDCVQGGSEVNRKRCWSQARSSRKRSCASPSPGTSGRRWSSVDEEALMCRGWRVMPMQCRQQSTDRQPRARRLHDQDQASPAADTDGP